MTAVRGFIHRLLEPAPDPLAELFARRHAAADADAARNEIRATATDNERRQFLHHLTGTSADNNHHEEN